MSVDRLMSQEAQIVTRSRTGPADTFGTPTWTESDPVAVRGAFQPGRSQEYTGPDTGRVHWTGYLPADTAIGPEDRIVMAIGVELEVVGPGRVWTNPRTGKASHMVIDLVEVVI